MGTESPDSRPVPPRRPAALDTPARQVYKSHMAAPCGTRIAGDPEMESVDSMLEEVGALPTRAPTMGRLQKVRYTHEAMIDLIISRPEMSQGQLAAHFGYTESWISNVLASDAFQMKLAARREEVVDPALKATIEERFRAATVLSLQRLQEKLAAPQVSDNLVLRTAELGAKALGIGGHAPPPAPPNSQDRLERLAARLITLQRTVKGNVYDGEADEVRVLEVEETRAEAA